MKLFCVEPLKTFEEAVQLASVRNECRNMMTNNHNRITLSEQKNWFEGFYLQQDPMRYKVWLLKESHQESGNVLGYFASKEEV